MPPHRFLVLGIALLITHIVLADEVVFGGTFSRAGGVKGTKCLATWDPCSETWKKTLPGDAFDALGSYCYVYSVAKGPDDTLFVGGLFSSASGVKVNNILSVKDGVVSDMDGGVDSKVQAILIDHKNGTDRNTYDVIFGGAFMASKHTTPLALNFIAKWNSKTKKITQLTDSGGSPGIPGAVGFSGYHVSSLAKHSDWLVIGGIFKTGVTSSDRWGYMYNGMMWLGFPLIGQNDWAPSSGISVSVNSLIAVSDHPKFYAAGGFTAPSYKVGYWNTSHWTTLGAHLFSSAMPHGLLHGLIPGGKKSWITCGERLLTSSYGEVGVWLCPTSNTWNKIIGFNAGMMMPIAYACDINPKNGTVYLGGAYMDQQYPGYKYFGNAVMAKPNVYNYTTSPLGDGLAGAVYAVKITDDGPCRPKCKEVTNCSSCLDPRWIGYCGWCGATGKCVDIWDTGSCGPDIKTNQCVDVAGTVLGGIIVAVIVVAAGLGGAATAASGFMSTMSTTSTTTTTASATSSASGAVDPLSYLFTVIDYMQFLIISSAMSFSYPDVYSSFVGLFSFISLTINIGWVNTNFPSVKGLQSFCAAINVEPRHIFLTNLIIVVLLMAAIGFVFGGLWLAAKWIIRKRKESERWRRISNALITLIVVLFFRILLLAYYNLTMTSSFQVSATDWSGPATLGAAFLLSLIVFVFFSIGFPLICTYILASHNATDAFTDKQFMTRFGCLFKEMDDSAYWFKIVEILRKFLQAAAAGILFRTAIGQYVLVTLTQTVYLVLIWRYGKYRDRFLRFLKVGNAVSGFLNMILLVAYIPGVNVGPTGMVAVAGVCVFLQVVTIGCNMAIYLWPMLKKGFLLPIQLAYRFIRKKQGHEEVAMDDMDSPKATVVDVESLPTDDVKPDEQPSTETTLIDIEPTGDEAPTTASDEAPITTGDEAPTTASDEAPITTGDEAPTTTGDEAHGTPDAPASDEKDEKGDEKGDGGDEKDEKDDEKDEKGDDKGDEKGDDKGDEKGDEKDDDKHATTDTPADTLATDDKATDDKATDDKPVDTDQSSPVETATRL